MQYRSLERELAEFKLESDPKMESVTPTGHDIAAMQESMSRMEIEDGRKQLHSKSSNAAPDKNKAISLTSGRSQSSYSSTSGGVGTEREHQLSDFRPIRKLYRGYASKVYLAEDMGKAKQMGSVGQEAVVAQTSKRVVLKVYDLLRLSPLTKFQLDREIRLHSSISHRHIIGLQAAFSQVCGCLSCTVFARVLINRQVSGWAVVAPFRRKRCFLLYFLFFSRKHLPQNSCWCNDCY